MGINVNRMITLTFVLSAVLASLAGFLLGPIWFLDPDVGLVVILKAFIVIVIGGFGSVRGILAVDCFLGVVEVLVASHLTSEYRDVISFLILIAVLIVLPKGFFGERSRKKCKRMDHEPQEEDLDGICPIRSGGDPPDPFWELPIRLESVQPGRYFIILTYSLNSCMDISVLFQSARRGSFAIGAYITPA